MTLWTHKYRTHTQMISYKYVFYDWLLLLFLFLYSFTDFPQTMCRMKGEFVVMSL